MTIIKNVMLLAVLSVASAYRHCPMDDDSYCPVICKPFKKQVPRPIIYNFCMIGCKAGVATDDVDCNKSCMHTDLPRPTTADACKSGCNGALSELHACNVLAKRNSNKNNDDLWIGFSNWENPRLTEQRGNHQQMNLGAIVAYADTLVVINI